MDKQDIIQFVNDNGLQIGTMAREGNFEAAKLMKDYSVWFRAHAPGSESKLDSKETRDVEMAIEGGILALTLLLTAVPESTEEDEDSAPIA